MVPTAPPTVTASFSLRRACDSLRKSEQDVTTAPGTAIATCLAAGQQRAYHNARVKLEEIATLQAAVQKVVLDQLVLEVDDEVARLHRMVDALRPLSGYDDATLAYQSRRAGVLAALEETVTPLIRDLAVAATC